MTVKEAITKLGKWIVVDLVIPGVIIHYVLKYLKGGTHDKVKAFAEALQDCMDILHTYSKWSSQAVQNKVDLGKISVPGIGPLAVPDLIKTKLRGLWQVRNAH